MAKSHRLTLTAHTAVVVHINHAAHVWLFDPANFQRYQSTGQADGWGGTYDRTPVARVRRGLERSTSSSISGFFAAR